MFPESSARFPAITVKGPATPDNYTGPIEFEVFQDNIYGTFMFGFIPAPTFSLFASPSSQSVVQGACASYTASISALVSGFNSNVSFNLSGLPANATGSFNPASITGAGSSTLTVCTNSSTPVGASTLTINAISGIEVHSTTISLTVNAPPPPPPPPQQTDFSLSAPFNSQTISGGTSGLFTVNVSALGGFTGTVALSASGDFPGSMTLSPTSIAGSGSSTLTVRAPRFASPGTYIVTVTGVSGNLSHSIDFTVAINCSNQTNCTLQ